MKVLYTVFFLLSCFCCANHANEKQDGLTVISLPEKEYHFGSLKKTDTLYYSFKIINTGKIPLKIKNVNGDCQCTSPSWPKVPILSGEHGFIKIQYIPSKQDSGYVRKSILIETNTRPVFNSIYVEGSVL